MIIRVAIDVPIPRLFDYLCDDASSEEAQVEAHASVADAESATATQNDNQSNVA